MKALFISALLVATVASAAVTAEKPSWVETNADALASIVPMALKQAKPVPELRNPLRVVESSGLPALKAGQGGKGGEAARLRVNLAPRIRSVVRGENELVAIDTRFLRIGDEVLIGEGEKGVSPVAGARVILSRIGVSELVFTIQALEPDGTTPWQTDVTVPLPSFLRKQQH